MCCTRYISPEVAAIEREWHVGRHNSIEFEDVDLRMFGTVADAAKLTTLRPADLYAAGPVESLTT